ncbi:hypothetical protein K438DRAFT_1956149 [Mycena galopus ATCC 62051]|nr:hypothetical protein K438DRAFT_1956149 [Mycena galopus ATCC 62051]
MSGHLRRRLAELDTQIVEQMRVLHRLQQARSDVERELYATAYPVLTLPTEITAEIFLCCLPAFDPLCIPKSQSSAPIVLSSVCREWRDIALATPALWSTLEVRFDDIPTDIVSEPVLVEGIVDRWLSRASNRPLSLSFERTKALQFTLPRLREVIHRWSRRVRYLSLDIGYNDVRPLGLDSAAFPLLEEVVLGCNDDVFAVFGSAPRLHDMRLLCGGRGFRLPWLQLTKFVGIVLWDLQLFTLAPNLAEITCTFDLDVTDFIAITHHSLRSLTIGENSDDILEYLTLPALQELHISDTVNCNDSLQSFLVRSSPPLVSLSIRRNYWGSGFDQLGQCLRLVGSTLEILKLVGGLDDDMLTIFVFLALESLPRLRAVYFKNFDGPFDLSDLVHFLYSRCDKLRTFKFVWTSSPFLDAVLSAGPFPTASCEDTINGHLSRLSQKGMEIYIGTADKNYAAIGESAAFDQSLL